MKMIPAEIFPMREFIEEEMRARGLSNSDLAAIIDWPVENIEEILVGNKSITPDTACLLAAAFGVHPQLFSNLENK